MGSSSKKVKGTKENRKRRHRSRSFSDEEIREKERHRHRKHHHRDRRHEKREKHREYESEESFDEQKQVHMIESSPERSESPQNDQKSAESLSIEETNKLRAKLGLKPLEVTSKDLKSDEKDPKNGENLSKIKDDLGEFYHKPATNLKEKIEQDKLRAKIQEKREKRKLEGKLTKTKTLGESDSDDDISNWVEKNRKIQKEKEQAAKRAKMLEELDQEFGIGEIIESETRIKKSKIYNEKNLRGLKVEHNLENFGEGKSVILTLKDTDVLDENEDVLVNVNMIDDEKYKKSNENKKRRPNYQPYEDEFDEKGEYVGKSLLSKYDEEIDGEKRDHFTIGNYEKKSEKSKIESVKQKLANKKLESLVLPELRLTSDYFTEEELVKFKKPKKKVKKLREKGKILTAAELAANLSENEISKDLGSRKKKLDSEVPGTSKSSQLGDWMEIDDVPDVKPILDDIKLENDDINLEMALRKARRLKQKEKLSVLPPVTELIKEEPMEEDPGNDPGNIILNSTAEFCRTLGDIPTYGKSGNRDEEKDLVDFEREIKDSPPSSPGAIEAKMNSWNPVDPTDVPEGLTLHSEAPILDEEPDVGKGVGNALKLALSKGYLDKEENNRPSTSRFAHLQAKHYSIEDKTYGDDDKFGGRRDRHNGPTQDFKEKETFKPNVKLEYIDDDGRVLNAKEAFRYLSHKFHGKGPGKNKIEKRLKKSDQEALMKKMSSTDTPLGTLNMLQHKQKEMQSPFIVLSGSKHTHSTSISKTGRR